MTINKLFISSAIVSFLMTSCNSFNPMNTAETWDVEQIGAEKVEPGPNAPYIGFNENKIYGFTGCNNINGDIEISGDKFIAKNVAATMKMCPDAVYEQVFLHSINEAKRIKETTNGFTLIDKDGKTLMKLAPRKLDVSLLEGKWKLVKINDNVLTSSEDTPFIEFNLSEKRLSGSTGCNLINDTLDPETLAECAVDFSKMAMTRRFCHNHEMETAFVDGMNTAKIIKVVDGYLYLYSEESLNCLVFKK